MIGELDRAQVDGLIGRGPRPARAALMREMGTAIEAARDPWRGLDRAAGAAAGRRDADDAAPGGSPDRLDADPALDLLARAGADAIAARRRDGRP